MPMFYFDIIKNGDVSIDHRGHVLTDAGQAHREAVRALAEIGAEEIPKDGHLELSVAVANDRHHILFRTRLSFEPGLTADGLVSDSPAPAEGSEPNDGVEGYPLQTEATMTLPNDPALRQPKGDHNRRIALGLDIEDFAHLAGVTPEAVRAYEATGPDDDFDLAVAQLVGAALERIEANPPSSQKVIT